MSSANVAMVSALSRNCRRSESSFLASCAAASSFSFRSRCSSPRRCGPLPGAHGDEGTRGRRGLGHPRFTAPAGDGAVAPHPAGVVPSPALTETKEPAGGVAWPYSSVFAPAGDGAVAPHPAGVCYSRRSRRRRNLRVAWPDRSLL